MHVKTYKAIWALVKVTLLVFLTALLCSALTSCGGTCAHTAYKEVEENRIEPICNKDGGYDTVVYCTDCGEELSREHHTTDRLGHDVVHHERKEPTCTEDGEEDYDSCTRCDYSTYRKKINMLGHSLVYHEGKAASCSEVGITDYVSCTRCDYSTYSEIPKLDHIYGNTIEENRTEPKCCKNGGYDAVVYCAECGEEIFREHHTLTMLGHDTVHHDGKAASCTEVGIADYVSCTRCDYSTYREIPKTDHYVHAIVQENRTEPTCSAEGGYDNVSRCICGKELNRVHLTIPTTPHTPGKPKTENTVQAVYGYNGSGKDGGYDTVVYCTVCGEETSRKHHTVKITAKEYYSQYDYLELSATVNAPNALTDNGDGTYILNAKTHGGKSVRLLIKGNIGSVDGGWGSLDESTSIYLLDALPGMNYVEYDVNSTTDFIIGAYYSLSGKKSVDSTSALYNGNGNMLLTPSGKALELSLYPDYFGMNTQNSKAAVEIVSIRIYFCDVMSEVTDLRLNSRLYSQSYSKSYLPGDLYDGEIEKCGVEFAFPLEILIRNSECLSGHDVYYTDLIKITDDVKFGSIFDAAGAAVADKTKRFLQSGDTIEVTVGNCTKKLKLCTEAFNGEGLYETSTVSYIKSKGTQNVLVVPITFNDQKDRVNDEWLGLLYGILGNVTDENGTVTKHKLSNGNISLSDFLYTSSYGKLTVNSYVTEPYVIDGNAEDYYSSMLTEKTFAAINEWLYGLGIDNGAFDQNGDGYYDVVIFVNTLTPIGNGYSQMGMSGAFKYTRSTNLSNAGTPEKPTVNTYLSIAAFHLFTSAENAKATTVIHEFGHALGLEDYYYNGYSKCTIGNFDMEADNKGDWNSYTKYLLGWIEPTVVNGTEDEVEITVRSYAKTGDAILIRALGYDGSGTPFDEYIVIDLFAHDGLYEKDAKDFGLGNAVGIRIYHVNSFYDMLSSSDGTVLAWPHHSMTDYSKYASQGKYLLEMVQKGNISTFMGNEYKENYVDAGDLFYAGDSFSVEDYDAFFHDGKMDNGMDFGYTVTVKEITEADGTWTATLVISKSAA